MLRTLGSFENVDLPRGVGLLRYKRFLVPRLPMYMWEGNIVTSKQKYNLYLALLTT